MARIGRRGSGAARKISRAERWSAAATDLRAGSGQRPSQEQPHHQRGDDAADQEQREVAPRLQRQGILQKKRWAGWPECAISQTNMAAA